MRKYIIYKVAGLALLVLAMVGCDTASQEVEPIVSPDDYPMVSFQSDLTGNSIYEGDTITYTITFDKMIDRSVTFSFEQTGGTAEEGVDFDFVPGIVQPWSTSAELMIIFTEDNIPETEDLTLQGELAILSVGDKYLVNQSIEFPSLDVTLKSWNDPTLLTISFGWNSEDDNDMVIFYQVEPDSLDAWSDMGATLANPEIDMTIWLTDPPGPYYVNVMHWGNPPFDYTFLIGHPDQTLQVITGTFDSDHLEKYTVDAWTAWGGSYDSYRILKIENDGTKFTVTKVPEM